MADFCGTLSPLKGAAASGPGPSPIVVAAGPGAPYVFAGGGGFTRTTEEAVGIIHGHSATIEAAKTTE